MAESYYIFKSGRLRRRQNTLYLECPLEDGKGVSRRPIPIENVRDLYLFGEIDLNTKVLVFLNQHQVPLHVFNYYGYYSGSFYPRESNVSGHLLVQQVRAYLSPRRRLRLARQFVQGALYHIRRNLVYYHNRGRSLTETIRVIERGISAIKEVTDIPVLMQIEGQCREAYYGAFETILNGTVRFEKRVRRPPDNMLNALLSFLNALMYSCALSEIYVTQLNPTVSYLHEPSERRFSLALDVAEVFKPLLVDRLIFRLLNRGVLKEDRDTRPIGKARGVYLTEEACKLVVREWDKLLKETVQHRRLKRNVSYRQLVRIECYKLIRHLTGIKPYRALRAWW